MGFIKIVKLFKRRLCYLKIFSYLCIVIDLELMPHCTIYNSLIFTNYLHSDRQLLPGWFSPLIPLFFLPAPAANRSGRVVSCKNTQSRIKTK